MTRRLPATLPASVLACQLPFHLPFRLPCQLMPATLPTTFPLLPPYPLGAVARPLGRAGQPMNIVKSFVRPFIETVAELNAI